MDNLELKLARANALLAAAARERERLDRELRKAQSDVRKLRHAVWILQRRLETYKPSEAA